MSGAWKNQERLVAAWFNTMRNPLSGRNNRNDDGSQRLGDILYLPAVIEVKRRGSVSMDVAKKTRALAREHRKPWAVFEFKTGEMELCKLTTDYDTMQYLCEALHVRWTQGVSR